MKKIVGLSVVALLVFSGAFSGNFTGNFISNGYEKENGYREIVRNFSNPEIIDNEKYVNVEVEGTNSITYHPGKPMLPVFSKTIKFPLGTKIGYVKCTTSEIKTMEIGKIIKPVPPPKWLSKKRSDLNQKNNLDQDQEIYDSMDPYPSSWYSYKTGGGIDKYGNHVLFLSIHFYPVRYLPEKNILEFVDNIKIKITYEERSLSYNDEYELVIIAPSEFSDDLQELVDHKNSYGIATKLVTLNDINNGTYFPVQGRDQQEKIKYFIKDAIENWGIRYALLVGSIDKLPICTTWIFQRHRDHYWNETILSDIYYADIYDANGDFCSWNSNNNGLYGEHYQNCPGVNDTVDLYPDVNIGRLACKNKREVNTVVDKIINYEEKTYGKRWFNKLILCGGDTFPGWGVYEGEVTNEEVAKNMHDFEQIKLWTSRHTFNPLFINSILNLGAGFIDYSGHGFEYGFGTHPPNKERWIYYFTPYLLGLRNGYRLPIIFFDACLTTKLDFTFLDILTHFPPDISKLFYFLANTTGFNISMQLPCFAWCCVKKTNGGAIATVGATRTAYTHVDENGAHAGAGYLGVHFFMAYEEGITVSQMLTQSQNDYIDNVGRDYFTLEEFILLGDPSLKVGGYP